MFRITERNRATMIGVRFTGICLLLTLTVLVPVHSVVPGTGIQYLIEQIFPDASRSWIITTTTVVLLVILLLSTLLVYYLRKNKELLGEQAVGIMLLQYLIVQPLGFYLLWATYLDFSKDGQLMFPAVISYPVSSFWFIAIGYLLDRIKAHPEISKP